MNTAPPRIWFEPELFRTAFDRRPFAIEHNLTHHPLFELERLIRLSLALPPDGIEYNAGDLPITLDPKQTPRTGLGVTETIRRIEECRSWMVLKNVERDAEYRALADRALERARLFCPDLRGIETFVFISSPDAVTPYHIDPECNFLLQIRGKKSIHVLPARDHSVVSEEELERFFAGGTRNLLHLEPDAKVLASIFELEPEQGVHVPVAAPHWVRNGSSVSISFSITFRTEVSDRREIAYRINHRLRKLRLRPKPVGRSALRDDLKYRLFDSARKLRRRLGKTDRSATSDGGT